MRPPPADRLRAVSLFGFLALFPLHAVAEHPLTLAQAIQQSLLHNSQIQVSHASLQSAEAKVLESRSSLYPQIVLQGTYTHLDPISSYSFIMGPGKTIDMKFGLENTYNAAFSLQHSLFDWGKSRSSVTMSEQTMHIAETGFEHIQSVVIYQVIQAYYGIVMTHEVISVVDQHINSLQEKLRVARERFSIGLASNFDILSIEVQTASLKSKKLEMVNGMQKMKLGFNLLLGRDAETEVMLADSLKYQPRILRADSLLTVGMRQRSELRQLNLQHVLTRYQIDFVRAMDKPNVNLLMNYGIRNGFFPNPDVLRGNWVAAVTVSYPLFDGFRISSQVNQVELAMQSTALRSEEMKNTISSEIYQALADVELNEQKIGIESLRSTQAQEALKIAEERHSKGLVSTMELLDVQTSLASARLNYVQSVHNYMMSLVVLDKATGKIPF